MKDVVIRLVLDKKDDTDRVAQSNVKEWSEGLEKMKVGLKVVVRRTQPAQFETCMQGGSCRNFNPAEENGATEASRQKKIARRKEV